jgi:hypothetical protein
VNHSSTRVHFRQKQEEITVLLLQRDFSHSSMRPDLLAIKYVSFSCSEIILLNTPALLFCIHVGCDSLMKNFVRSLKQNLWGLDPLTRIVNLHLASNDRLNCCKAITRRWTYVNIWYMAWLVRNRFTVAIYCCPVSWMHISLYCCIKEERIFEKFRNCHHQNEQNVISILWGSE